MKKLLLLLAVPAVQMFGTTYGQADKNWERTIRKDIDALTDSFKSHVGSLLLNADPEFENTFSTCLKQRVMNGKKPLAIDVRLCATSADLDFVLKFDEGVDTIINEFRDGFAEAAQEANAAWVNDVISEIRRSTPKPIKTLSSSKK